MRVRQPVEASQRAESLIDGQDGLAAILRSALREDTEDTGGFVVVVVV